MGQLDQLGFERLVEGGCTVCNHAVVEIHSFIDRSIVIMLGEPNDEGRWAHDGEKFVDGTYRIVCASCGHVVFACEICPRCNAPGALTRAISERSRLAPPKRCMKCNELELLALSLIPATAHYGGGGSPKPTPIVEFGDPGYHVVAYACEACDHAVVAEGCPLCAAPGPLRPRP